MILTSLFKCCYVVLAFCVIPMLVSLGVSELFFWLVDKFGGASRAGASFWICLIASTCAFFFSMKLMYVLTIYVMDSYFADAADNQDQGRGVDRALPQDNLQQGIEALDRTRRVVREPEEERKQKLQDLFKLFPSVSYTSQGTGSEPGDCAICMGQFVEGELCWVLPSCKHMFHSFCIVRWLTIGCCCPVCRNSVLPV